MAHQVVGRIVRGYTHGISMQHYVESQLVCVLNEYRDLFKRCIVGIIGVKTRRTPIDQVNQGLVSIKLLCNRVQDIGNGIDHRQHYADLVDPISPAV